MRRLHVLFAAVATALIPATVFAQEVIADADLAGGWQVFLTILAVVIVPIGALVGWALVRLAKFLGVKTENETVAGIIKRIAGSVSDAVAMVSQTVKKEIKKAKHPDSPGGEAITAGEAKQMGQAVWKALEEEYGSLDKIFKLLSYIGLDQKAATSKINTMIQAAVAGQKAARPGPQ